MSRKLVNILLSLLILAGAAVLAQTLISSREPLQSEPREAVSPLVSIHTLQDSGADIRLTTQGSVTAKTTLQLTSDVAGRLVWLSPDLLAGNRIAADTPLARVDKTSYQLALAQARLALRDAEISIADARSRFQTRDPRHPQIQRAEAQLEAARAQIDKAQTDLERTEITLPVTAVVTRKNASLGQYVSPGAVLAELDAIDSVEVALPLSLAELELLRSAQSPTIVLTSLAAQNGARWPARLARVRQQLDSQTRVAYAVAEVDQPYDQQPPLRLGQFVSADIGGIRLEGAFRVPSAAVFDNDHVYRVSEDERLQRVAIEILRRDAHSVVARGELNRGDRLVLSRLDIMTEGMRVRPEPAS